MNKKVKLGLLLFLIGFAGVLSTLTMDIPLPEEIQKEISVLFSPWEFKLLSLINPTLFLTIGVVLGILFYDEVHLKLPVIENLIYKNKPFNLSEIIKYGIVGGIISGILIVLIYTAFTPILPAEFIKIGEKFKLNLIVRFLYGGLTEEILVRFGIMTLFIWLLFKISGKLTPVIYVSSIIFSAIIFGVSHLPIVYILVGSPTTALVFYIILGNMIGGIIFGWLYWKKGLESAMIAHIVTHIVLLIGEAL